MSLANVSIRLRSDGSLAVGGSFSKSGSYDSVIENVLGKIFTEALKTNPQTGQKSDFAIAAQYLEGQYDHAFDDADKERKVEVAYRNGKVESRISSPEEEERLTEKIAAEAKSALAEMGVDAGSLEVVVNEDGKLAVASMPQNKQEADALRHALDVLNNEVKERSNEDYNAMDTAITAIDRLKALLAKMDVFRPGGLGTVNKTVK